MTVVLQNQAPTLGLQNRVLARVREQPGETMREISSYLEAGSHSVSKSLTRLKQQGEVEASGGKYYPVMTDDFDHLVRAAEALSKVRRSSPTRQVKRGYWLNLPAVIYPATALIGYGLGRWH